MNTPHTENATQAAARIAKEDADRANKSLPAYTAAEREQVEHDRAAAAKDAADKVKTDASKK